MELGLFQPSWKQQASKIDALEPCRGFLQTPQNLRFFSEKSKLLKIDRYGLSNWTLRSKLQQFRFKIVQAERKRCDSTGNPWAFVFSFRTESICASRQRSYVPTPPPHNRHLFLNFGAIFLQMTLNFLVNTIRQVLWPSACVCVRVLVSCNACRAHVREVARVRLKVGVKLVFAFVLFVSFCEFVGLRVFVLYVHLNDI